MIALLLLALAAAAPCVRLTRAGTQVQGDVRVCPGHYRIADPTERGVLVAASSGTRIDLSGVTIESGDSVPARYVGIGVASRGVDGVTVLGGVIRGYRYGVRLEGGRNHRLSGMDVSGSRRQLLRSTAEHFDSLDRLDVGRLDASDLYGAGLMLRGTTGASVTSIIAHGGQNGIGLVDASESYVADNDLADNSGWAIHPSARAATPFSGTTLRAPGGARVSTPTAPPRRSCSGRAATRTRSPRTSSPPPRSACW